MADWVGEWTDDFLKLHNRTGPSMSEEEGQRPRFLGADVDEMNPDILDRGPKLRMTIEQEGPCAPVVGIAPVTTQLLDGSQGRSL